MVVGIIILVAIAIVAIIFSSKGDKAGSTDGGCFVSATRVRMADGSPKLISDLQVGDSVLSQEPDGPLASTPVLKIVTTLAKTTVLIKLSNGGTIEVSPTQPLFKEDRVPVLASAISAGTRLLAPSGAGLVVLSATTTPYNGMVYCVRVARGNQLILHTGQQESGSGSLSARDIHDPVARAAKNSDDGQMGQVEK